MNPRQTWRDRWRVLVRCVEDLEKRDKVLTRAACESQVSGYLPYQTTTDNTLSGVPLPDPLELELACLRPGAAAGLRLAEVAGLLECRGRSLCI